MNVPYKIQDAVLDFVSNELDNHEGLEVDGNESQIITLASHESYSAYEQTYSVYDEDGRRIGRLTLTAIFEKE